MYAITEYVALQTVQTRHVEVMVAVELVEVVLQDKPVIITTVVLQSVQAENVEVMAVEEAVEVAIEERYARMGNV